MSTPDDGRLFFDLSPTPRLRYTYSTEIFKRGPLLNIGSGQMRLEIPGVVCHNHGMELGATVDHAFDLTHPWPIHGQQYGVITAFHVLEHIPVHKVLGVCQEAYRCLKSGGIFIAEMPDATAMCKELVEDVNYGMLECIYGLDYTREYNHRWAYTKSSAQLLFKLAGFQRTFTSEGKCYHHVQQGTVRVEGVRDGRGDQNPMPNLQRDTTDAVSGPGDDAPGQPVPDRPVGTPGHVPPGSESV